MSLNVREIEKAIKQKGMTKSEVAELLEMSREGFTRSLATNKLQADKIELLAKLLKIPVAVMFGETIEVQHVNASMQCDKCNTTNELLRARDSEISALKKVIMLLENREIKEDSRSAKMAV